MLLAFVATFAALFAIVAVSEGIGHPDVPAGAAAIVEGVPDGEGTVTEAELRSRIERDAATTGGDELPDRGSAEYMELKNRTLNLLLDEIWLYGLAGEMGISVSDREVGSALANFKEENFEDASEYRDALRQSNLTQEDHEATLRAQLITEKIQEELEAAPVPEPTSSEIEAYYGIAIAREQRFTQPATRDIRMVFNLERKKVEKAKRLIEADDSEASWRRVANRFSMDQRTRRNAGLDPGLTEESVAEGLKDAVFSAPEGQMEGPILTPRGYWVFEVVNATPKQVQSLESAREEIESELLGEAFREHFDDFVNDHFSRWRARTFCAPGHVVERCANYRSDGRHPDAEPGCFEAAPENGRPEECPAAVMLRAPAQPGSVSVTSPRGTMLPQRPWPSEPESAGE